MLRDKVSLNGRRLSLAPVRGVANGVHSYNFNCSFILNHCNKKEISRPAPLKVGD